MAHESMLVSVEVPSDDRVAVCFPNDIDHY